MLSAEVVPSKSLKEEVQKAIDAGIVVVASAGNDKKDASGYYPASIPDIITVAAVNSSNKPSTFSDGKGSNYGNYVLGDEAMTNRIKELRKQQGYRQEDLAEALNVSRQTIIAIENDKYNPTLELAMKLARYLNTTVEELFILDT